MGSGPRFPLVFGFDKSFQVGETGGPEAAVLLDPRVDGTQGLGIEVIDAVATFPMLAHQVRTAQQTEVL